MAVEQNHNSLAQQEGALTKTLLNTEPLGSVPWESLNTYGTRRECLGYWSKYCLTVLADGIADFTSPNGMRDNAVNWEHVPPQVPITPFGTGHSILPFLDSQNNHVSQGLITSSGAPTLSQEVIAVPNGTPGPTEGLRRRR